MPRERAETKSHPPHVVNEPAGFFQRRRQRRTACARRAGARMINTERSGSTVINAPPRVRLAWRPASRAGRKSFHSASNRCSRVGLPAPVSAAHGVADFRRQHAQRQFLRHRGERCAVQARRSLWMADHLAYGLRAAGDHILVARHALRQPREALGCETLARERPAGAAQSRARKILIDVGRVFAPPNAGMLQRGDESRLADPEQRPQQRHPPRASRARACRPVRPARNPRQVASRPSRPDRRGYGRGPRTRPRIGRHIRQAACSAPRARRLRFRSTAWRPSRPAVRAASRGRAPMRRPVRPRREKPAAGHGRRSPRQGRGLAPGATASDVPAA